MKKKVFIIIHEHFDIMWRRCFDRDFQYKGKNYISYADLEAYYIKAMDFDALAIFTEKLSKEIIK